MFNECDGSTSTVALPMTGFSPLRTLATRSGKRCAASKPGHCNVEISNEFLTAKSAGCHVNKPSPRPIYDVFLGGSCGNTVWRRDLVIPYLEKRAISYYDPQRSVWNEHMINEESVAKENSSLFLFVLDPATVNATSFLEIAHFAARKAPKLVVVFLGQSEWTKRGHPEDLSDRRRTCDLLDNILTMHEVPVLQSIQEALCYIDEIIIGEKSWSEAMSNPLQRLPYVFLRGRRTCRQSMNHMRCALRSVKDGVAKWRGTKFLLLGLCEILMILAVHFFVKMLPLVLLLVPIIALDFFLALFSAIYYRYKLHAAVRRTKLVQHNAVSLPIPDRAIVPCNIVAQQIPLSYCYQSMNCRNVHASGTSLHSKCKSVSKRRSYDSNSIMVNPFKWFNANGYDVFLGCSSRNRVDLAWINHLAAPQLHRKGLSFCSDLMVERHMRLNTLHMTRHILYHISSCETMLSGMVEVAYFLGHATMELTICVPKNAKVLDCTPNDDEELRKYIERRNESYRMAFCYLRDMAERRHCENCSRSSNMEKKIWEDYILIKLLRDVKFLILNDRC